MVSKLKIEKERVSALYSIALDLLHHQSLEDVLKTIVYRASELLDSPICFLDLVDGDEFVIQAATPMVESYIGMRVPAEKAVLTGLAIRNRTPDFKWNTLVDWTSHASLRKGRDVTNRLRVIMDGEKMRVYLNGVLATFLKDNRYKMGKLHVVAEPNGETNLGVAYSDLQVREAVR